MMESTPDSALPDAVPAAGASVEARTVERPRTVPYWHTFALIVVLAVLSHGGKAPHGSHVRLYLATIVYEWLFTAYIWWGISRAGMKMRELIGGRWQSVEDFLLDVALSIGVWIGALILIAVAAIAMGMQHTANVDEVSKQIGFLAPQSGWEIALWLCLSATAGFCEEILFRGYFQMQFTRLLCNRWLALAVVSILFGLGHGYEGAQRMVLIALLGFAFGIASIARKSLRPAMMAHTLQDAISGILLRALR
jgi:hypothetical protein